ncbi:MAG: virulence factor [Microcystaceae cyanobacterium]
MKLSSLETTPNPNCMKLNLDEQIVEKPVSLQRGQTLENLPDAVKQVLEIEGVREAFLASNFITLTRQSHIDWPPILQQAARLLGVTENADTERLTPPEGSDMTTPAQTSQNLGEVEIAVLVFRGLPGQVRVIGAEAQARVNLPARFNETLQHVLNLTGANYVQERNWEAYPPRHGQPDEVAKMVADEVASLIDEEELVRLEKAALVNSFLAAPTSKKTSQEDLLAQLNSSDWKPRLQAIQKLEINAETFPVIVNALDDEKAAIRRWAAALLGASASPEAVEPLSRVVLKDPSVVVRRTAGDALSDLGKEQAIPTLCKALEDGSKLVRWRAARFLKEMGDETALAALQTAQERESEFDVRLEIEAAFERIAGGGERQLPMWMRLSQS